MDWLKPFMTERKCAAGEILFYKDEKAEDMFYIVSGRFKLVESGIELPVGAIVGEFGMLSPSNARTQTLEMHPKAVSFSVSAIVRSRNSTCRTRRSAFTFFGWSAPGCFRTSESFRRAAGGVHDTRASIAASAGPA